MSETRISSILSLFHPLLINVCVCVCVCERERERDVLTYGGKKSKNLKNKEFEFDMMVTCCARFKEKIKKK